MALVSSERPVACLLLTGILLSGCARSAGPHHPAEGQGRAFHFTYQATIADLPDTARQVRLWVPLAKTRDNQRIRSRRIHTAHPYEIHEEPTYGNDMLTLALSAPVPRAVTVSVEYAVDVLEERPTAAEALPAAASVASADELSLALRDEPLMVVNDVTMQLARQAIAGQVGELAKARAIYDAVIRRMQYDKTTPGWGRGDTVRACRLGRGNCTDFHALFISMARSVGIPARFVIGAPIPADVSEGAVAGYHCWAEFYSPPHGWMPVDASEAWKHPERKDYYFGTRDPNRILLSVGRNLQLVPAQAGPPVNIFVYPYVEIDGQPGGSIDTRFQFRDRQPKEA